DNNDVGEGQDILQLKFLFMEQLLGHEAIMAWLDSYAAAVDIYEKLLLAMRDPELAEWSTHQQLIIEATIMKLNMQRTWIQLARQRLAVKARQGG
ncbi:MAG: hypothetical protein L0322_24635, partial [Chloroflexi bacterium]|nr:hypothetical protein [Chloroflexota bacterium]